VQKLAGFRGLRVAIRLLNDVDVVRTQNRRSNGARDAALDIAMLLNALLMATALCVSVVADRQTPISSDKNWNAPHNSHPSFEPFTDYEVFWRPSV
jgi:hypothetical protein